MDCPLARIISEDTFGVLGFTGSLMVNVDPLPVPCNQQHCIQLVKDVTAQQGIHDQINRAAQRSLRVCHCSRWAPGQTPGCLGCVIAADFVAAVQADAGIRRLVTSWGGGHRRGISRHNRRAGGWRGGGVVVVVGEGSMHRSVSWVMGAGCLWPRVASLLRWHCAGSIKDGRKDGPWHVSCMSWSKSGTA